MPANIVHNEIAILGTTSGGTFSQNTDKLVSGILRLIVLKPATNSTTYRLTITDSKNNEIYYNETPVTGTLREQVAIPIKDVNTITVSSASEDELFTGKMVSEE